MTVILSPLTNIAMQAKALSDLTLVTPGKNIGYQPQNKGNENQQLPPTFFFNYEGENKVLLKSQITDHYVENNSAIANQIALAPEEITVSGFVGELNDIAPTPLEELKKISEKLTIISNYVPGLSLTALLAYENARFAYATAQNIINNSVQTWQSINNTESAGIQTVNEQFNTNTPLNSSQTQQQLAFLKFYAYYRDRRLFTVQTPWAIFTDMAIMQLTAMQDSESRQYTNFEITFKKIRFATTKTVTVLNILEQLMSQRAEAQRSASEPVKLGTQSLEDTTLFPTTKLRTYVTN